MSDIAKDILKGIVNHFKDNKQLLAAIIGLVLLLILLSSGVINPVTNSASLLNFGSSGVYPSTFNFGSSSTSHQSKKTKYTKPDLVLKPGYDYKVNVETSLGSFVIDVYEQDVPVNANNFIFLASRDFYDGLKFHFIRPGMLIQAGDPDGNGLGNAGYYVDDEVSTHKFGPYTVAMANQGPNTNGSQFFITVGYGDFSSLDGRFTIIGKVSQGQSVIDDIANVKTNENGVPITPVLIKKMSVVKVKRL